MYAFFFATLEHCVRCFSMLVLPIPGE